MLFGVDNIFMFLPNQNVYNDGKCYYIYKSDNKEDMDYYDEEQGMTNPDYKEDWFLRGKEIAHENENSLGSFTFNRKERLDVKKPGPFFPNSENNFFFEKVKNINCVSQ